MSVSVETTEAEVLRREWGRAEVAAQLHNASGAGQDHVGPRLSERRSQPHSVDRQLEPSRDPGQSGRGTDVAVGREPAVGQRLFDDHAPAPRCGAREGRARRGLQDVPGCLDALERIDPIGFRVEGALHDVGLAGPAHRESDQEAPGT